MSNVDQGEAGVEAKSSLTASVKCHRRCFKSVDRGWRWPLVVTAVLLAALCVPSKSALLPGDERQALIAAVLKNFWGQAKLSDGRFAQPASEEERHTIPITNAVVHRALDAGEVSGLAEWCKLDWESHCRALTRAARTAGLSDKQVAFVSVLHGAAQGRIASAMATTGTCSDQYRRKVEPTLKESTAKGIR
jgi:hypothetical protein